MRPGRGRSDYALRRHHRLGHQADCQGKLGRRIAGSNAAGALARQSADAERPAAAIEPLTGYTFEGYRNPDGSVGTKNVLAISTSVQCVAGTLDFALKRIREELLPQYPNVDDVIGMTHAYSCGVAINAPGAAVPIRTFPRLNLTGQG